MNWSFLISFGVGLGIYLFVLAIVTFVKRRKNKKIVESDKDIFENQNQDKRDGNVNKD